MTKNNNQEGKYLPSKKFSYYYTKSSLKSVCFSLNTYFLSFYLMVKINFRSFKICKIKWQGCSL